MITRKRKQMIDGSVETNDERLPIKTKLTKHSKNESQSQQITNFLQDLKQIVKSLFKNHDECCQTLLENVLKSSHHKTKAFKNFRTSHSSILKKLDPFKTLTAHDIYNDFVVSACLYHYCKNKNDA